jgi:tryptophan synthase beta subunit
MATEIEQRFGRYGGRYVPETLMPALAELEREWMAAREDRALRARLDGLLETYVGRPSPLYLAERLSERACTRARTRSTMRSVRRCWRSGWASGA